jgi:hypothetical protein
MQRDADILGALRAGRVALPPLRIRLVGVEPKTEAVGGPHRPDAYVDVQWEARTARFVVELRGQATPKVFRDAVEQVRAYASAAEMLPMVVVPYLSPERLSDLESRGVSGLDLCGNGVVVVPGELFVSRTGNPNQYPAGRRIRNVYQGASSLVARVFLARPAYESVQAVMDEIIRRGGAVALSTVSKVLKMLDEDLVIRRAGRTSELLQADELLDRLADAYKPPAIRARRKYRWTGDSGDILAMLRQSSGQLVLTGAGSVDRYAVMPREKTIQCYCGSIVEIEEKLKGQLEESPRFPDLDLIETDDPTVFFDSRIDSHLNSQTDAGIAIASPTQCWIELQAGDKRQRDAAVQVRKRIVDELRGGERGRR